MTEDKPDDNVRIQDGYVVYIVNSSIAVNETGIKREDVRGNRTCNKTGSKVGIIPVHWEN